ncbi:MAG: alanine/glycine:cation symporter family protein [Gammaproteobacteria bacterium]
MEFITNAVNSVNGIVWGVPMIVIILGTGLYLQFLLRGLPIRRLGYGFRLMWQGRRAGSDEDGEVSPFAALMTALAATVGTGNIVGVATAIAVGGPGALFWMWCTALVGMATKYAEVVVAVHYRKRDDKGDHVGGPMYAIKNGLGKKWAWLGVAFAIFGGLAGFGIGNTVQSNAVADALYTSFGVPEWVSGVVIMVLVGLVVLGGIRRIGRVAQALVPFMCIAYVLFAIAVLFVNAAEIPTAFVLVFKDAFTPTAATGGFAGAAAWTAIRFGVARGIFSNEAGLGTAGIAQAAGTTKSAVRSGLIGMLGTFIDTLIVCSFTGLAIITVGVWKTGESGAALTSSAFEISLPGIGGYLVAASLAVFAFTTMLGWAYYGEKCWEFLVGTRSELPFRILWILVIPLGAVAHLNFVWLLADTLNAFMAIPNLIALLLLSPVILKLTREYFASDKNIKTETSDI